MKPNLKKTPSNMRHSARLILSFDLSSLRFSAGIYFKSSRSPGKFEASCFRTSEQSAIVHRCIARTLHKHTQMSSANTIVVDEIDTDADKDKRGNDKTADTKDAKEPHQVESEIEAKQLGMGYFKGSHERLDKEVEKAERDKFLVEMDERDDPKNLSVGYKWYLTILSGCQILNATFASSVLSSAYSLIEEEYGKSQEVVILTVSLFLVGYIVGPFFWSPLNELVGRKVTFMSSLFLFVIFTIPCALAPNMACLLVCRFLAGCCAAASMVTSGGVLADLWDPVRRGRPMALYR